MFCFGGVVEAKHHRAHDSIANTPSSTHLDVLADGVVEDSPVFGYSVELDLLGVEDELAHHHRLVLGRVPGGREEFLQTKKKRHNKKQMQPIGRGPL